MIDVGSEEFERLVRAGLDSIPDGLLELMDNVVILVEEESPSEWPHVLGLYEGVPLTARGHDYMGAQLLPDTVRIFRGPILRMCHSREEVVRQVRITVVHEVAHHFGIEDERLRELGWG